MANPHFNAQHVAALAREYHQGFVMYYGIYRKMLGSTTGAILLSYLMNKWDHLDTKTLWHTDKQVMIATHLTPNELRGAKKCLGNSAFVNITLRGIPPKTHYEIDEVLFAAELHAAVANLAAPIQFRGIHEINLVESTGYNRNTYKTIPSKDGGVETPRRKQTISSGKTRDPIPAKSSHGFQRAFIKRWDAKYKRPYPFQGVKDGAAFKKLQTHFKGDRAAFRKAVDRYLAKQQEFFHGHPITKLLSNVSEFMTDYVPPHERDQSGEPETGEFTKVQTRVIESDDTAILDHLGE